MTEIYATQDGETARRPIVLVKYRNSKDTSKNDNSKDIINHFNLSSEDLKAEYFK